jgi:6-phosphofructokinase 2
MTPIVTLTLNPTVDLITGVDRVEPDRKLRMDPPRYDPGGGGINVSRAVHRLGGSTFALYTAGGPMGELLERLLTEEQINSRSIAIDDGNTRVNPNIFEHGSDRIYRFIMPGPRLDKSAIGQCHQLVMDAAQNAEYLVISGSLPEGVPEDTYADIINDLREFDCRVLLDTSGDALKRALDSGAYLIKPNLRELSNVTGRDFDSDHDIVAAAQGLIDQREVEVLFVSLGGGGALVVTHDDADRIATPTVTVRSRVGAGDSLMAGLALSLARGWDLSKAARFGIAAGAAAVMTPGTELCRREDTERLFDKMTNSLQDQHRDE